MRRWRQSFKANPSVQNHTGDFPVCSSNFMVNDIWSGVWEGDNIVFPSNFFGNGISVESGNMGTSFSSYITWLLYLVLLNSKPFLIFFSSLNDCLKLDNETSLYNIFLVASVLLMIWIHGWEWFLEDDIIEVFIKRRRRTRCAYFDCALRLLPLKNRVVVRCGIASLAIGNGMFIKINLICFRLY